MLMSFMMQQGGAQQQLNIHYSVFLRQLSYLNLLMIFVVPALTMRLFSEEKKMKTMDLLMTSPVTSLQIVVGKYLAALAAVLGLVLVAIAYPLATIPLVDNVQWAPLLISFSGIFLVGSVYAAMNLFCSSLTEHSLVAFVMSVILNLSIWFIGMGADAVDSEWARKVFEHISLNTHLAGLIEGTVRTPGLVFLFSLVGLFVFLTERVIESSRWRST
jgi:ABC-2 type transport system permease protein